MKFQSFFCLRGCVVKCGRASFMPALAHFGRFGGLFRKSGPTDRLAAKRPVKRKFRKINGTAGCPSMAAKYIIYGVPEKIYKNYKVFFGN